MCRARRTRKPPRRWTAAWLVSVIAVLALLVGVGGPTISFVVAHDHEHAAAEAHADGSPCPHPCSDGHDCGTDCSCACCHARVLATRIPEPLSITRVAPAGTRDSPPPTDPEAEGIARRVFHPPRG